MIMPPRFSPSALRSVMVAAAAIAFAVLALAGDLAAPAADRVSAQDGGTTTPASTVGELVVVPGVVQQNETVLAVGFHVVPADLEVEIHYSGHFTPEDETCDTAGTAGSAEAAAAPVWITLNACTQGDAYVRLVEAANGNVIKDVGVTVVEPGATGQQQRVTVTIDGLDSTDLVPDGSGDRFSVSVAGLEAHREHILHTVVLNSLSAAFNRGCTRFRESDSIVGLASDTYSYSVYGCVAPGNRIWSYVEDLDGTALASTGRFDNPVNVKKPTVSFKPPTEDARTCLYSVDEGDDFTVTVELSHPSTDRIPVPIRVSNRSRAEDNDYNVTGLTSTGRLIFFDRITSKTFVVETEDETNMTEDRDDETVVLEFFDLPSFVSGIGTCDSANITILDDEDVTVSFEHSSYTVNEGMYTGIKVELNGRRSQELEIPIVITDNAESGDYTVDGLDDGILTFGEWREDATFWIDTYVEEADDGEDEELNLRFGDLPSGIVTVSPSSATVTIKEPNSAPTFDEGRRAIRSVAENTPSGTNVGNPVTATDANNDTLTYQLRGTDARSFTIVETSSRTETGGQIKTSASLNFEAKTRYSVTVNVSDGRGGSDSIEVTINVTDVNEPPGRPSAPTVTANGETSLNVEWSTPTNTGPPINDYDVRYRVGSSGSFTSVSHRGTDTQTTISSLAPGTSYQVQVRAENAEGPSRWSASGTGSTDAAPEPTITIVRHRNTPASVTEGGEVRFTLRARPAPTADLAVSVTVAETDPRLPGRITDFVTGDIPDEITIAKGTTTADLILETDADAVDETNVSLLVRVEDGDGYTVGNPNVAVVTIEDDDPPPPAPTGLRANGDLDSNGNVTLRWNAVSGATGYKVQYIEEVCDSDGNCGPDPDKSWKSQDYTAGTTGTVIEAALGELIEDKLYRVEVQAVIADASEWSDSAFVYPTDDPLRGANVVATAPFHGYHDKNAQGSHEFLYVLCEETIPAGLDMTAQDMKDAVEEWEDAVIWDRNGANIIAATPYSLSDGEKCTTGPSFPLLQNPYGEGVFEVRFASNADMNNALCVDIFAFLDLIPGCWRSPSWTDVGIGLMEEGSVLLNAGLGAATWNLEVPGGGCTQLHELIVHEVGHAFGIGSGLGDLNRHPVNTEHSVMSYQDKDRDCEPQAYDIVALLALYQSR